MRGRKRKRVRESVCVSERKKEKESVRGKEKESVRGKEKE